MKLRSFLLLLMAMTLVAAGCGSDDGDKDAAKDEATAKMSKAEREDRDNKQQAVDKAEKEFKENPKDSAACRNVAMARISLASPASPSDPKDTVELPADRDENLKKAIVVLEDCAEIDKADRDIRQMLASTYMATSDYEKATALLKDLATTARGDSRANAYYAWGLAAQNAQEYDDAIKAWATFVRLSPPADPRVKQVRQSIAALRVAAKAPKPAATPAAGADAEAGKDSPAEGDAAPAEGDAAPAEDAPADDAEPTEKDAAADDNDEG